MPTRPFLAAALLPLALAGCAKDEVTAIGGSYGKSTTRNICPSVAIPAETGDVTLFDPPASRDARAIDVVATIAGLRDQCTDDGASPTIQAVATFRIDARRSSAAGARDVTLPYFAVVARGGDQVVSKSLSRVAVHFDDGKLTASTTARADAGVARAEAALPQAVREKISRKRDAKDADASIDPMSDPQVRAALNRAGFELLVGFQLTPEQLAYNATR